MAKKSTGEKKTILRITLVLLLILLFSAGLKIYEEVFADNVKESTGTTYLFYYTNKSMDENFREIATQKVLKKPASLQRILWLTGYSDMVKPGRYKLKSDDSNLDLLRMMVTGRQEPMDIVFTQANRLSDIAGFWGNQLEADSSEIEYLLQSNLLQDSFQLDIYNRISFFIPNTYNFYWNTSADKLISRMMKEYRSFWDSTKKANAAQLNLSIQEIAVLASIVQKETNKVNEIPVVAGVYYNRLAKKMPLQADPTILFVLNDNRIKRVGGEMLKINSPYNTYTNVGLPPGPICMPSVQAINAVLHLKKHKYLYFCAKEDFSGYHNFAVDFNGHQLNARKYQRALNKKGIK